MKPIIMGALALGGAGTIWALSRKKAPAKKKGKLDFKPAFQLHITKTAAGVPVKVATPVPTGATAEQKTATPSTPPLPPPPPKPPANPVASAAQSAVVQTAALHNRPPPSSLTYNPELFKQLRMLLLKQPVLPALPFKWQLLLVQHRLLLDKFHLNWDFKSELIQLLPTIQFR